jgi:hypothetical protein
MYGFIIDVLGQAYELDSKYIYDSNPSNLVTISSIFKRIDAVSSFFNTDVEALITEIFVL